MRPHNYSAKKQIGAKVLVIDDDASVRFTITEILGLHGYQVVGAEDGREGLYLAQRNAWDAIILDYKMPRMDGMETLMELKRLIPDTPVIFVTAHGNEEVARQALQQGAYDYFSKPFDNVELRVVVGRAVERHQLVRQVQSLSLELKKQQAQDKIISHSARMCRILELVQQVAPQPITVLITGESGTGKELIARAIHAMSHRADGPFVAINCAAIPEGLLESELFGHERGAFTGAVARKTGHFEAAQDGTLFLDEIGDMALGLQGKLLRVLQEGEIMRVGGHETLNVNTRIVAATNQNLPELVASGKFREDLFYRINVINLELPALRHRTDDIPLLCDYFISKACKQYQKKIQSIAPSAMELLMSYPWPGNIRELENVITRAVLLAQTDTILVEDLPREMTIIQDGDHSLMSAMEYQPEMSLQDQVELLVEQVEKRIILAALEAHQGHRGQTAEKLQVSRRNLHRKMQKYNIS